MNDLSVYCKALFHVRPNPNGINLATLRSEV